MSFELKGDFLVFDKLKGKMKTIAETSMTKSAIRGVAFAQKEAPIKTGRLRTSITYQIITDDLEITGIIGTNVAYGPFVEFGTSRWSGKRFLRPGLQHARDYLKKDIESEMRKAKL